MKRGSAHGGHNSTLSHHALAEAKVCEPDYCFISVLLYYPLGTTSDSASERAPAGADDPVLAASLPNN
jgi:hypothetical protein